MAQSTHKPILITVLLLLMFTITYTPISAQDSPSYTVDIDPANFVAVIDNPYQPRLPGMRWVYEGQTAQGLERVEIEVLTETREIMGVQTTIVRDTVYLNGEVREDTYDWLAQDQDGNVWYFGEDVSDFQNGQLSSKAGSWEAGVDGALPGIVMFGDPAAHIGEIYLQEYYVGAAEDTANLLSATGVSSVPFGDFDHVVLTYEYTPLDQQSHEIKFYAQGVGQIKTIDLTTGEMSDLIEFSAP